MSERTVWRWLAEAGHDARAAEEPGARVQDGTRFTVTPEVLGPADLADQATDEQISAVRQARATRTRVSTAGGQTTYPSLSYYHASKWGIEGFCETVAREIAPFDMALTIIEPGATPTSFGSSLDTAPPLLEYENTPATEARQGFLGGHFPVPNSAEKIADAMLTPA